MIRGRNADCEIRQELGYADACSPEGADDVLRQNVMRLRRFRHKLGELSCCLRYELIVTCGRRAPTGQDDPGERVDESDCYKLSLYCVVGEGRAYPGDSPEHGVNAPPY